MMTPKLHPRTIQELSTSKRVHFSDKKKAGPGQSSRLYVCPILTVLLGALASAGLLAAQEPPKKNTTQDSGIVLQQTVRRVRVDVVVTDAHGHPVTGLQASDFHVAEDGNPQSIRQFEWRNDENAQPALPKRPPLPAHTFMNVPETPEHGPLMVVLYDVLNTQVGDQLDARRQMVEFLKRSAGRRIAIFVLGDRLRLLQGFTSDTELLVSAVNRTGDVSLRGYRSDLTGYPVSPPASPGSPTTSGLAPAGGRMTEMERWEKLSAEMTENARQSYASELLEDRVKITLDALVQIGRYLAGLPGRKNLIWYSGSFPAAIMPDPVRQLASAQPGSLVRDDSARSYSEQIVKATNLLNTAEVSIYPIDARGLLTDYPSFAIRSAEFSTMDMVGEQTGGRAFYNTNGLKEALETAADEGSSYYSLVYAPTNSKYDGSVRHISVRLAQGHYQLAYRRSYIAEDAASTASKQSAPDQSAASQDQTPVPTESTTAAAQFGAPPSYQLVFAAHMDAVGSPVVATAEQLAALAPYREQAAKAARKKFVPPAKPVSMQQYVIQYGVPVGQLDMPRSANGVYHSDISMAVLAFNEDGETLWGTNTELKDDIPASKIEKIRKDGFQAIQTFFVPVETAVVRLVVCDEHSKRVGSMEVRLPLPPDQQKGAGAQ